MAIRLCRTTPSFRPLEQRLREEKACCEQGDAEQQAGQEQAERVHDERPPGLELTEHQRWVRTGFRRSPLRGDRATGSDHGARNCPGCANPRSFATALGNSPATRPAQTARCERNERQGFAKRCSRLCSARDDAKAGAKGLPDRSRCVLWRTPAADLQRRQIFFLAASAAPLGRNPIATRKSPLNRGMWNWCRSAI
jgi:hypothetical protein